MNWQPIETAPKSRNPIDLWTARKKRVTDAEWNAYKRQWECRVIGDAVDPDGGWQAVRDATHWMPLPPPPVVKESLTPAMDDDLDEPPGKACSLDNPDCEACS
jgi:hypothetical protein